jgi:hypothetical protein
MTWVVFAQSTAAKACQERLASWGYRMKWTAWQLTFLLVVTCAIALSTLQASAHLHGDKPAMEPGWSELMRSMDKMHTAMASLQSSDDGDVDFVKLMLVHHQAAIDMAQTELAYGKDPQMRRLAQEIITDQKSEIDLMQLWLKQHPPGSAQVKQPPAPQASKEQ